VRDLPKGLPNRIRVVTIARRLTKHQIDIGVAQPVPRTEAEIAHAALLADFEKYLVKCGIVKLTRWELASG
jgi:integrase/recombinase XerD